MPAYTEETMQQALLDVESGTSLSKASKLWGVPRSTLISRQLNGRTAQQGQIHHQRLWPSQERRLARWILAQEARGVAISYVQVRELATRLLRRSGDEKPLGKHWVTSFKQRNPDIETRRALWRGKSRVTVDQLHSFDRFQQDGIEATVSPESSLDT